MPHYCDIEENQEKKNFWVKHQNCNYWSWTSEYVEGAEYGTASEVIEKLNKELNSSLYEWKTPQRQFGSIYLYIAFPPNPNVGDTIDTNFNGIHVYHEEVPPYWERNGDKFICRDKKTIEQKLQKQKDKDLKKDSFKFFLVFVSEVVQASTGLKLLAPTSAALPCEGYGSFNGALKDEILRYRTESAKKEWVKKVIKIGWNPAFAKKWMEIQENDRARNFKVSEVRTEFNKLVKEFKIKVDA